MKTFSKVLSLLLVFVMCMSLLGTSALALDLELDPAADGGQGDFSLDFGGSGFDAGFSLDGSDSQSQDWGDSWDDGFDLGGTQSDADFNLDSGEQEQYSAPEEPMIQVSEQSNDLTLAGEDGLVANSADGVVATVGNIGYKKGEVNNAIANGGTLTIVSGATVKETLIINKPTTIKLNNGKITGDIIVYSSLTIEGDGNVNGSLQRMTGGSIVIYGGTYADPGAIDLFIASGYKLDGSKVVAKTPGGAVIAQVNSKSFGDDIDTINSVLASTSGAVKLYGTLNGTLIFHSGGSLDLNGNTLNGGVLVYNGSVSITDSATGGTVTGTVSAPSGFLNVTGGTFTSGLNKNYIANGYILDGNTVVPIASANAARIGNRYYSSITDALNAAQSGDTVVVLEHPENKDDTFGSVTIDSKNITLQLGSNGFSSIKITNSTVNFVGGFIGTLEVKNYSTANINGTRVDNINSDSTSKVNSSSTGGGSSSGGGSGSGSGSYYATVNVYNTPYLKYSGSPVYFQPVNSGTFDGFAYFNAGSSKSGQPLGAGSYRFSANACLILDEDFLNRTLADGDYDLYGYVTNANGSRTFTLLNRFAVYTGSPEPTTSWWLTPDYSKWYTGEDPLVFESNMFDKNVTKGMKKIIPSLRYGINGSPTKSISVDQYWEFDGNGYFMLGKNFLNSLSADQTYYLQVVDLNNPSVNYTNVVRFRLGPTLKAIDTDKHVVGSTKNLRFLASEPVSAVYVGNIQLTSDDDYAIWNGGKTVVLSSEFLNKRTPGNTYTVKVLTYSGDYASANFQILTTAQASSSPRTGDTSNIGLWSAFLLLSGTAIVVLVPKLRKHEM